MNLKKAIISALVLLFIFNVSFIGTATLSLAADTEPETYTGGALPSWITHSDLSGKYNAVGVNTANSLKVTKGSATAVTSALNNHRTIVVTLKPNAWTDNDVATMEFRLKTELTQTLNKTGNSDYYSYIELYDNLLMNKRNNGGRHYVTIRDTYFQESQAWRIFSNRSDESQWTDIALTRNKTENSLSIYINKYPVYTFDLDANLGSEDNGVSLYFRFHYLAVDNVLTGNPDAFMELDDIKAYEGEYTDGYKISGMSASIDGGKALSEINAGDSLAVTIDPGTVASSVTDAKYILTLRKGGRLIAMNIAEQSFLGTTHDDFRITLSDIQLGEQTGDYELTLMVVEDFAKLKSLCGSYSVE